MSKLDEIKQALAAVTSGKWEWKGRIAPDWMPDTFSALDDLRVQIPTPEKDTDFDISFVVQAMKPGYVMVRNADANLIANAPDYLRALLPVIEAAKEYHNACVTEDSEGDNDTDRILIAYNELFIAIEQLEKE